MIWLYKSYIIMYLLNLNLLKYNNGQ